MSPDEDQDPAVQAQRITAVCREQFGDYLERILTARVYEAAIRSPLDRAEGLSTRLNHAVWFKREDLQPVFSFKIRGAFNKIAHLDPAVRANGVIAASAGNHAQGVATAGQIFGCRAVIVMPADTPEIKVSAVRRLGGEVVLFGASFQDAYAHARALAPQEGLAFVHPYDDPDVIAGQGTVGMEIAAQHSRPIDAIFVPVGGGGLISGIALYMKRLYPSVQIIGVEPTEAPSMHHALHVGERVWLDEVGRFADGVAVKQVGEETFRICKALVDDVILVDTDEICAAIKAVFTDTRSIMEPAGALGVAGAIAWAARNPEARDKTLIAVLSGANMNFKRLGFVSERAEIGTEREVWLCVEIPERPGAFLSLSRVMGSRDVTEFNYRYADAEAAHVFVAASVRDRGEGDALIDSIREAGFRCWDLSDNDVAKTHLKHMVGGRSPSVAHERIFQFSFPERPGALRRFLENLPGALNISLFHYRNHGSDVARVLAGIQVPPEAEACFLDFLVALAYPYTEETDNPAVGFFL